MQKLYLGHTAFIVNIQESGYSVKMNWQVGY